MTSERSDLLRLLAELSEEDESLRLGQLIANLATQAIGARAEAVWDAEDGDMAAAAERLLSRYHERRPLLAS